MTLSGFKASLAADEPPGGLSRALEALWHAGRGDWDAAHELAQSIEDKTGAWVHAHLHRQEGDLSNAAYWYRRAGEPVAQDAVDLEWERLVRALIAEP